MRLLNRRGQPIKTSEERAAAPKASDPARIGDVLLIMQEMNGPIAAVLRELMTKVARLEDRLGITNQSVSEEYVPPTGQPLTPTGERAMREMMELYPDANSAGVYMPHPAETPVGYVPANGTGGDLE